MRQGVSKEYLIGSRRNGRGFRPFPFDRFLNSRLGRPWDEVYSEMSGAFDHRSLPGYSFFRDLRWHVQTDCWVGADTGSIFSGYGSRVEDEFYVHPWTGLLCWAEPVDRSRPDPPKVKVDLKEGKSYEKIDGIWYYLEEYDIEHEGLILASLAPTYLRPKILIEVNGIEFFYRTRWTEHVSVKRQLNKKELRANGLHNGSRYNAWKRCNVCGASGFRCVHIQREECEKRGSRYAG